VVKVHPTTRKVVFDGLSIAIRYLIQASLAASEKSRCDDTRGYACTSAHRSRAPVIKIIDVRIAYFSALICNRRYEVARCRQSGHHHGLAERGYEG
jgi:hypothetical protein